MTKTNYILRKIGVKRAELIELMKLYNQCSNEYNSAREAFDTANTAAFHATRKTSPSYGNDLPNYWEHGTPADFAATLIEAVKGAVVMDRELARKCAERDSAKEIFDDVDKLVGDLERELDVLVGNAKNTLAAEVDAA